MRTRWLAALGVAGTMVGAAPAQAANVPVSAARASSALLTDGRPSFGEWPESGPGTSGLRLATSSDATRLHVLVDALGVRSVDEDVRTTLAVDVNRDGRVTPRRDLFYVVEQDGTVQLLRAGGTDSPPEPLPTESSAATTRDCFAADGTRTFEPPRAAIRCDAHHASEFSVELSELGIAPGESVNVVTFVTAGRATLRFPPGDPERLDDALVITTAPPVGPQLPPPADLQLDADSGLEVLQSTAGSLQHALVADKPTVVRVLPRVGDPADDEHPATVRLTGLGPNGHLPGSPLTQPLRVRANPDRMVPADGATFQLPASWIKQGTLSLLAHVTQGGGPASPVAFTAVPLRPTFKTSVWTVPLEAGSGLPTPANMALQESRSDTILPVADMYFPRRPAESASRSSSGAVAAAKKVYAAAEAAWAEAKQKTGTAPYRLPRQVWAQHSEAVGDGGLSDPVWSSNGEGVAIGGDDGTSRELTMAHEINHNLDRSDSGTWGRHIRGCDAKGLDPLWPFPDSEIQDKGYDVPNLLPVDTDEIDLMSYCRKDTVGPAKWIGLYRWENLLDVFRSDGSAPLAAAAATTATGADPTDRETAPDVLQISGVVDRRTGSVSLDPVFRGPGIPDEDRDDEAPGTYAMEVLGTAGDRLVVRRFDIDPRDVEGALQRRVPFGFDVVAPGEVREIRVVRVSNGRVLARRVLSASAPQVRIVVPNGGEQLPARPFDLVVDARDPDRDALTWRVEASGDGGATWQPVPGEPRRGRLAIDPSTLPGGDSSLLRVIATDGLRTSTDESDAPFALPVTPPQPSILQPLAGAHLRTGQVAVLRGTAVSSSLQELPAENLLWFDGDRLVGEGEEARVLLGPGPHQLRFVAVDAVGQVAGSSQVRIEVGGTCGDEDQRQGRGHQRHGNGRGEGHRRHGDGVACGTVVPNPSSEDPDDDEGRDP